MNTHVNRPGITSECLNENKIRQVDAAEAKTLCGCEAAGIFIPYHQLTESELIPVQDPPGVEYGRLRKNQSASDHKYHQRGGTSVHAYLPQSILDFEIGTDLVLVEGEFKALSLSDSHQNFSVAAVGLSGFFGFHLGKKGEQERELAPELAAAIEFLHPKQIFFLGDSDTAFNFDFSKAAIRLKEMLPDHDIRLPRIPLLEPKGIDDCRAKMDQQFHLFWLKAVAESIEVTADTTEDSLALKLAQSGLKSLPKDEQPELLSRIVKFAARLKESYVPLLAKQVKETLKLGKTEFSKLVAKERVKLGEQMQVTREETIRKAVKNYFYSQGSYYLIGQGGVQHFPTRQDVLLSLGVQAQLSSERFGSYSEAEFALNLIQRENSVAWAGHLGGRTGGLQGEGSQRILILGGPKVIAPRPDISCTWLLEMLADLVGRVSADPCYIQQYHTLMTWLACRRKALANPSAHLPTPLLVLVGPVGIGKSLVQNHILTPLLGGRSFDPTHCWTGRMAFNSSVLEADHLTLEDPMVDTNDTRALINIRSELKRAVSNESKVRQAKFQEAVTLRPVQGVSISLNDSLQSLQLLPLHDPTTMGKMILLRCHSIGALPSEDPAARTTFLSQIQMQLPGLIAYLDQMVIHPEFNDDRFGVAAFHHPSILALARVDNPLHKLASMLERTIVPPGLSGTAQNLHQLLATRFGDSFLSLVPDAKSLGKKLSLMPRDLPEWKDRISAPGKQPYGDQGNYATIWQLSPPKGVQS